MLCVCVKLQAKPKSTTQTYILKIDNRGQKQKKTTPAHVCGEKITCAPGVVDCLIDYFPPKDYFHWVVRYVVVCVCVKLQAKPKSTTQTYILKIDNRGQKQKKTTPAHVCGEKITCAPGVVDCLIDYFPPKDYF